MKITDETKAMFIYNFNLDPKEQFEMQFDIHIVEEADGTLVAYAGTFADTNGYNEKKKITSTEDIAEFFKSYINDVIK
jgi:hypothetical protein